MAEQLICNQQVDGSTPFTSSIYMGEFPSGQRGQTVNLLSLTSLVRIQLPPPYNEKTTREVVFSLYCEDAPILGRARLRALVRILRDGALCSHKSNKRENLPA